MGETIEIHLNTKEKAQLELIAKKNGVDSERLILRGIKMIIADNEHFNHLLRNIYIDGYKQPSNYQPRFYDVDTVNEIYNELLEIFNKLKKITDNGDIEHAPNSWKDCLRDFLLPEVAKVIANQK